DNKQTFNNEEEAEVVITLTQEDSRYHGQDYTMRAERDRCIGFAVQKHKWSLKSKLDIPKVVKINQDQSVHITHPFQPCRDVTACINICPG
ncbi:unnamed protein product, partial [Choristocarpus tenellus]